MRPSKVLREVNPTKYFCGMDEYVNGEVEAERLISIYGEYYEATSAKRILHFLGMNNY
ncbi:hypothetical protein M0R04_15285 [Candidatus Dojkabacteria bacterium]|nr:hypothetical protein [Candidatus Dojkabacteria bacterium]